MPNGPGTDDRTMILRSIVEIRPGMVLGVTLRNRDGHTVLGAGEKITSEFLARLESLGYSAIWIDDEDTRDIPYQDPISDEARTTTTRAIHATFSVAFEQAKKLGAASTQEIRATLEDRRIQQAFTEHGLVERLSGAVTHIVKDLDDRAVVTGLSSLRTHSTDLYHHSLDMAVTATMIARILGYDRAMLGQLTAGCLLHDIGTLFVDPGVMSRPSRLSEQEFRRLTDHTSLGYLVIRDSLRLGAVASHVAYQHHEWQDGSGYPRGLTGSNRLVTGAEMHMPGRINPLAEIAAIADLHDACSTDRAHRPRMAADQVWYAVRHAAGTQLNRAMVDAFLAVLPRYPLGTQVEILDGRWRDHSAVVVRVPSDNLHKPLIRVLSGPNRRRIATVDIDLRKEEMVICGHPLPERLGPSSR